MKKFNLSVLDEIMETPQVGEQVEVSLQQSELDEFLYLDLARMCQGIEAGYFDNESGLLLSHPIRALPRRAAPRCFAACGSPPQQAKLPAPWRNWRNAGLL